MEKRNLVRTPFSTKTKTNKNLNESVSKSTAKLDEDFSGGFDLDRPREGFDRYLNQLDGNINIDKVNKTKLSNDKYSKTFGEATDSKNVIIEFNDGTIIEYDNGAFLDRVQHYYTSLEDFMDYIDIDIDNFNAMYWKENSLIPYIKNSLSGVKNIYLAEL